MITPEERAIIRTRYIARCQVDTLHLHSDLCMQVLSGYGCEPEIIPDPNRAGRLLCASWPNPGQARGHYSEEILPHMVRKVLERTEQADATHAADALAPEEQR